jgi:CTP-dependent riboflavin kinase
MTETGRHPPTMVEIASDVKLRDDCDLADGDEISVEVED